MYNLKNKRVNNYILCRHKHIVKHETSPIKKYCFILQRDIFYEIISYRVFTTKTIWKFYLSPLSTKSLVVRQRFSLTGEIFPVIEIFFIIHLPTRLTFTILPYEQE